MGLSKGLKMRLKLRAEMAVMFVVMAGGTVLLTVGGFKAMIWSYGGSDGFRRYVIKEPLEKQYFRADPAGGLTRDGPLAGVPEHITALPSGDNSAERSHQDF